MWKFVISSSDKKNWYNNHSKEVCFIGRSNVGKSSLINSITGRKGLARTSNTPGRTQLINYFQEDKKMIVDLPGYGFAKMPSKEKAKMVKMISEYFEERSQLIRTFILIDAKIGPTQDDYDMMNYLKGLNRRFMILITKHDKAKQNERSKTEKMIKELKYDYLFVSSHKGTNITMVKKIIDFCFK